MSEPKHCPTCGADVIEIGEPEGTVHYEPLVYHQDTDAKKIRERLNEWFVSSCGPDEPATDLQKLDHVILMAESYRQTAKDFYWMIENLPMTILASLRKRRSLPPSEPGAGEKTVT